MSFPNIQDLGMDELIDGACVSKDGFLLKQMRSSTKSKRKGRGNTNTNTNMSTNTNPAARQIALAYEEHAAIIDKLKRELETSKDREKALVSEFSNKFQELHDSSPMAFDAINTNSKSSSSFGDDCDEMPMDEMADTARMERSQRTIEQIEQKRALEGFKRKIDHEMKLLREKNQTEILKIENSLKKKVSQIETMKKKFRAVSTECDFYKKQNQELEASINTTTSTASPSMSMSTNTAATGSFSSPAVVSVGDPDFNMDMDMDSPNTPHKAFISPMTESPIIANDMSESSNLTPLQRLRNSKQDTVASTPSSSASKTTPQMITNGIGANESGDDSPEPTSRLDALFQKVTDPNLNSLHNVLKAVEHELIEKEGEGMHNIPPAPRPTLSHGENDFVERIKFIFESSQKEHVDVIESLKSELEATDNEFLAIESKSADIETKLDEKKREIQDLRDQLSLANESAKNKSNLEGMLRMVSVDQKSNMKDHIELKKKLQKMQQERDRLLLEQTESQAESKEEVEALNRVLTDVTAEKETRLQEMEEKLDSFASENILLRKKLDSNFDPATDTTVVVDGSELMLLRQDSKRCLEMEQRLVSNGFDDAQGFKAELEAARKTIEELEEKLQSRKSDVDEVVELQMTRLQDENSELKEKLITTEEKCKGNEILGLEEEILKLKVDLEKKATNNKKLLIDFSNAEYTASALSTEKDGLVEENNALEKELDISRFQIEELLKTARDVHARERELEDELSKIREMMQMAMAEKDKLEVDITLKDKEARLERSDVESKLKTLQIEVIEMKEEKLSLRSKVREAESSMEHSNRIMSLMQETSDTEGTASMALLDMKKQLYEQQELHDKLRHCCDQSAAFMIDKLDRKVHTTLCLLETGALNISGASSVNEFDFSSSMSPKEQLMERALRLQRTENDRIRKNIDELQSEKDQENAVLGMHLATLQGKHDLKVELLAEKEKELQKLQSQLQLQLQSQESGYFSDEYSDTDDDEALMSKLNDNIEMKKACAELQSDKENAEKEAKVNAESLANAKMIISSLEQSNRTIVENLRERLSDSNGAIVSLLEQSKKYEEQVAELKSDLSVMAQQKEEVQSKFHEKENLQNVNGEDPTFQEIEG